MTAKGMTRPLLLLTFNIAIVLLGVSWARADLRLQQKAVIGFPVDGIVDVAQIDPAGPGGHRLAVLHQNYLLGLQWSPQRNVYDQTFFVQLNFSLGAGHIVIADVNGDGRNDVVVFGGYFETSVAKAYDSITGAFLKTIQFNNVGWAVAEDVDGIPGDEIIVNGSGISAYKGEVQLWHSPVIAGLLPSTRGVSATGEIFLTTETELIVLDARSGHERRRMPLVCCATGVGQSHGSPVLLRNSATDLALIDGITGSVHWTQPVQNPRKLAMFDVNGDGVDDVIIRSALFLAYNDSISVLNPEPLGDRAAEHKGAMVGSG